MINFNKYSPIRLMAYQPPGRPSSQPPSLTASQPHRLPASQLPSFLAFLLAVLVFLLPLPAPASKAQLPLKPFKAGPDQVLYRRAVSHGEKLDSPAFLVHPDGPVRHYAVNIKEQEFYLSQEIVIH